jgi:DNA-binding response OmpR family regulator
LEDTIKSEMEKKIVILYIEDDPDDIELLQDALSSNNVNFEMKVIMDGKVAIDYLRQCNQCPNIIVLDYNLPKVHGREILKEIRSLSALKHLPVLVLTTSSNQMDMNTAIENGASGYMIKPTTMAGINHTVQSIVELAL